MFLLVPAYPGCPGSKAVKWSLLLLLDLIILTEKINSTRYPTWCLLIKIYKLNYKRLISDNLTLFYLFTEQNSHHIKLFMTEHHIQLLNIKNNYKV